MHRVFIALFLGLALTACSHTQVGCSVEQSVATTAANAITQVLQCAHPEAVRADIAKQIAKVGLCSSAVIKTGSIAAIVCPTLSHYAASVIPNIPPASWGCTAENVQLAAAELLTTGCEFLPF